MDDYGEGALMVETQELLKEIHALEVRILTGIQDLNEKWRTEVTGVERRLQLELHKLSIDMNARMDTIARDAADKRAEVHREQAKDNGAKFMAAVSVLISIAMAFAQFMGARLVSH